MQNYLRCLLLFCLLSLCATTDRADTIVVNSHQSTDMTWHGSYDEWSEFPDKNQSYRKVTMDYTMGCASDGCSEWDYTTKVIAMKPTGAYDSVQKEWPHFKVNGNDVDSVKFSQTPTYRRIYDSSKQATDSVMADTLQIVLYEDANNVKQPTDTIYGWEAGYYNPSFDNNGTVIDSQKVAADTTWLNQYSTYYQVNPIYKKVELAKAITPYGGYMKENQKGFNNDWEHRMVFNVTDFQELLSDSVKIRVFYDGWSSGFSASIKFRFIEGKPPRSVRSVKNLYQGSFTYENPDDFEDNKMPQVSVDVPEPTNQAKVRVIASGHGFDNNQDCAEFCKKNYFLKVNGDQQAEQLMWRKDCGMNPIYPQGGTWLLNRANWCPGTRVNIYEHEIGEALQKGENKFNIDIEPIIWSGEQAPSYQFAVQLITYDDPERQVDASLQEIVAPSSLDEYARINPVVMKPRVKVKNTGSSAINSIRFAYHAKNTPKNQFTWNGTIEPMKSKQIAFPGKVENWRQGDTVFKVDIMQVNGQEDDYSANDQMASHFERPPELPNRFVISLTTNRQAAQNRLIIENSAGDVLYYLHELENQTTYEDTVELPQGYGEYRLILEDDASNQSPPNDENGLYSPFLRDAGSGSLSIEEPGQLFGNIKSFDPDFGSKIVYHFTTGSSFLNSIPKKQDPSAQINITPNPSSGPVRIDFDKTRMNQIQSLLVVNQYGQVVSKKKHIAKDEQLNFQELSAGVYFFRIQLNHQSVTKKVVINQ